MSLNDTGAGCIDQKVEEITFPFRVEIDRLRDRVRELETEVEKLRAERDEALDRVRRMVTSARLIMTSHDHDTSAMLCVVCEVAKQILAMRGPDGREIP